MAPDTIEQKLDRIEDLIREQSLLQKDVLNLKEACLYLSLSRSYLYKLTSKKLIPHFCPEGKRLFFERAELDAWLRRNRVETKESIETRAADYLIAKGKNR